MTEDRKGQGLVLDESISKNIALVNMLQLSNGPFVDDKKLKAQAENTVQKLRIKTESIEKKSGDLSGGNQQKVVIGNGLIRMRKFSFSMNPRGESMWEPRLKYIILSMIW